MNLFLTGPRRESSKNVIGIENEFRLILIKFNLIRKNQKISLLKLKRAFILVKTALGKFNFFDIQKVIVFWLTLLKDTSEHLSKYLERDSILDERR